MAETTWYACLQKSKRLGAIDFKKAFSIYEASLNRDLTQTEATVGWVLSQIGGVLPGTAVHQCKEHGLFFGARGRICPFCGKVADSTNGLTASDLMIPSPVSVSQSLPMVQDRPVQQTHNLLPLQHIIRKP